jgi:hypothetical protein
VGLTITSTALPFTTILSKILFASGDIKIPSFSKVHIRQQLIQRYLFGRVAIFSAILIISKTSSLKKCPLQEDFAGLSSIPSLGALIIYRFAHGHRLSSALRNQFRVDFLAPE